MKKLPLLAAVVLAACEKPPVEGGLTAAVKFDMGTHVTCVSVSVIDPMTGMQLGERKVPRAGKTELFIGIRQADLPADVTVRAMGYYGASGCLEPIKPNSSVAEQPGHFTAAKVTQVDLILRVPNPSEDVDADGYTGAAAGGPDCDDARGTVNPGEMEACQLPGDVNCNGLVGCNDPTCAGQACIRPAVTLAFSSAPQSVVSDTCSQALVIEARDDMGSAAPVGQNTPVTLTEQGALSISLFTDSSCTISGATLDIPRGQREVRFYARARIAGVSRLNASTVGFNPGQQDFRVLPGPPVSIAFANAAQTVKSDACSAAVVVEARDQAMNPAPVPVGAPVALTLNPAIGTALFSDANCMTPLTMPAIAAGTPSLSFYFKPTRAPGSVAMSAVVAAPALGSAMQTQTIIPGDPTRLVFATAAQTVAAGACSGAMTVKVQDGIGTDTVTVSATSIGFAGPSFTFYSTSTCAAGTAVTSASIPSGMPSVTVYFTATTAGPATVTASGGGLAMVMQTETVSPATASRLGFSTMGQGLQTGACSGPVRLSSQDAFGNASNVAAPLNITLSAAPPNGFTFFPLVNCGGTPTGTVQIPAGTSNVVFSYRGDVAGNVVMTADSSLDPDPTQVTNIGVSPASRLVFLSGLPQSVRANVCSAAVTIESQDATGNRSNVGQDVPVMLSASPPTSFQFFSDSSCNVAAPQALLTTGTSQVQFYFRGTTAGTVQITLASSLTDPAPGAATITPDAAAAIVFANPPRNPVAGTCSQQLVLESHDAFGNVSPVATPATATLAALPGAGLQFYGDAACAGATIPSATIGLGTSSVGFYARGDFTPGYTLSATASGLGNTTQPLSVTAAGVAKLIITTGQQALVTGQCSGAFTIERRDTFDNPITIGSPLAVGLGTTLPAVSFYAASNCTGGALPGATSIPGGSQSVTVHFRSTAPGMPTLTASSPGVMSAQQTETVIVAPPTQIVFTTAAQPMVTAGSCSGVLTIESRDAFMNTSAVQSDAVLTFTAPPSTFAYYSDPSCSTQITNTTIGAGFPTTSFYFKGDIAQTFNVAVTSPSFPAGASQMNTVVAGPASRLVFTNGPFIAAAGACSTPLTVRREDMLGNQVTAGSLLVNLAGSPSTGFALHPPGSCGGAGITSVTIGPGSSTASFSFRGTVPNLVTVTVSGTGVSSAMQTQTVNAIPPTTMVFTTTPLPVTAGACTNAFTVEARDGFGNQAVVTAATVVNLSAPVPATATFFTDPGCSLSTPNVTIPMGGATATFYVSAQTASAPTWSIGAMSSLATISQNLTVNAGPASRLLFVPAGGQTIGVGRCSPVAATVRTADQFNNISAVTQMTTVTPASSPAGGVTFFNNAVCTTGAGGAFTLSSGQSTGSFYMLGGLVTTPASVTVTVNASPPLTQAQQVQMIVPGAASRLAITSGAKSLMAGECSTAVTVQARDAANNDTTVSGATSVMLGVAPTTGFGFFSDPGCTMSVSAVTMSAGTGTVSFYVRGVTGGSFDMTVSGLTTPDTQTAVIESAVRTGVLTVGNGSTSQTAPIAPALRDVNKSFLAFNATITSTGMDDSSVRCELTDTVTVSCFRSGNAGNLDVRWYVVTRPSGLTVQHVRNLAANTAALQTVPITTVNAASSFVLLSTNCNSGNYNDGKLTSAKLAATGMSVDLERNAAPGCTMVHSLQVVTWTGSTVTRGSITITNGNNTPATPPTLPSSGGSPVFLLHTWRWGDSGTDEACRMMVRGAISSPTSLLFSRAITAGGNCDNNIMAIEYERVALPAGNRVDTFPVTMAGGVETPAAPLTLASPVDLTRSLAFFAGGTVSGQSAGECLDTSVDRPRDCLARATFLSTTTLEVRRGTAPANTASFDVFAWQIAP